MDIDRAVLTRALTTGGISTMLARGIEPRHFAPTTSGREASEVYEWATAYARRYNVSPSQPLVKERFPNWRGEPSSDPLDALIDAFIAQIKRRTFQSKLLELAPLANDPSRFDSLDEAMLDAARDLCSVVPGSQVQRLSEMHQRIDAYERDAQEETRPGIALGIPAFDEVIYGGIKPGNVVTIAGYLNLGKALDLSTPVPTPFGWTTMGEIKVGDQVFASDGHPTTVTAAYSVLLGSRCYEIGFSDGSIIVADEGHLWRVYSRASRLSEARALALVGHRVSAGLDQQHKRVMPSVMTTREMAAFLSNDAYRDDQRLSIPCAGPLQYPEVDLPIDPYIFGYWLGDGDSSSAIVTVAESDLPNLLTQLACTDLAWKQTMRGRVARVRFGQLKTCCRGHDRYDKTLRYEKYGGCIACQRLQNWCGHRRLKIEQEFPHTHFSAQQWLGRLGVQGNKHIPDLYLRASVDQRLALLQGLVDTDGSVFHSGRCEIAVTNRRLADGILDLALGLGIRATLTERPAKLNGREVGRVYRVGFVTSLPVARLSRKRERLPQECRTSRSTHRSIKYVREVPSRPVRCIEVDSANHLFLVGRACIPTHNSLLASWLSLNFVEQDRTGLFLPLEMSASEVLERVDTMITNFSYKLLATRKLPERDLALWRRMAIQYNGVHSNLIIPERIAACTIDRVYAEINRYRPDFTVIDYVQLMRRPNPRFQKWEGIDEITNEMKAIARATDSVIIMVSQDNRDAAQNGSTLSNMSGHVSVGQAPDLYIGLEQTPDMRAQQQMRVKLLKSRRGPRDLSCDLIWQPSTMTFRPPKEGDEARSFLKAVA